MLRSMERGEGSSLACRLGPQRAGAAQGGTRPRSPGAVDLRRVIQNVGQRLEQEEAAERAVQAARVRVVEVRVAERRGPG